MFQDIFPHIYQNSFIPDPPSVEDILLLYSGDSVLCREQDGSVALPCLSEIVGFELSELSFCFRIDGNVYRVDDAGNDAVPPEGYCFLHSRQFRNLGPADTVFACAVGESIHRWRCGNRFCGKCGGTMHRSTAERALICGSCGQTVYPKICPAVIVAVTDGDRLVLTRYKNRPFKRYALVAGFNEIGESIEDTVRREVLEETGLRVKNLRFYKSQPWVFTDSLLMGFFCDLDGGDAITVEEDELAEAGWFDRISLPEDHSGISLTGEMIELFRKGQEPK